MESCAIVAAAHFNANHFQVLDGHGAFDCVIAVDGGYRHLLDIGREADMVLGDFDSLGYVPQHHRLNRYDSHKDASDLELAIDAALEKGVRTLVVYGCLSGRLDHTLAALQQLARASEAGAKVTGVGEGFAVRVLAGPDSFEIPFSDLCPSGADCIDAAARLDALSAGCEENGRSVNSFLLESKTGCGTVSVLAASDEVRGVTETGMEYPLQNALLSNRTSLGLSNELVGQCAQVSVEEGTLYVFYPLVF